MSFDHLGLSAPLIKAVTNKGYTLPSPIQKKAIPVILKGRDVLASAQTGTGKTAGFTLPILELLSMTPPQKRGSIRALVLTPTRELAAQILENVESYSENLDIRSTVIFGGVKQNPQVTRLRRGIDFLIATPGRLLDLHHQGLLPLSNVEVLVLDEADRMLDMGFIHDIKKVLAVLPSKRQNLLFSATFSKEIKRLANEFLDRPVMVEATPENSTVDKIVQKAYRVDNSKKADMVIDMIAGGKWQQVLVFTRTKHGANRLTEKMNKADVSAAAIHGNKSQAARTKALKGFKDRDIRVLVATDIAARGLDIPLLPHVINYELPNIPEDYVHRIGRTGRAGARGEAIALVDVDEMPYLEDIEYLIKQKIPTEIMEGFEPTGKATGIKPASNQRNIHRSKKRNSVGQQNGRNKRKNWRKKPKKE